MKSKRKYSDHQGKPLSRKQARKKSTPVLFAIALNDQYNDDVQRNAFFELCWRANAEVYKTAKKYCQSKSAAKRELGIQIFGSFGRIIPKRRRELLYFDERVETALRLLKDNNKNVASSAAWALAYIGGDKAVAALIKIRKNKNDWVRWAVILIKKLLNFLKIQES